jgi:putative membrane protein
MHGHKTGRLNWQALLETLCFTAFASLTLALTISGAYRSYVTPRMVPYLYFTSAVMLVWALSALGGLFHPPHKTRLAHCLVLLIPIVFFLLPHGSVKANAAAGYINGGTLAVASNGSSAAAASPTAGATAPTPAPTAGASASADVGTVNASENESAAEQNGLSLSEDGSIQVSDEQFYPWLSEIFGNPDAYEGVPITLKGFVFKDPEIMSDSEFVPARMLMYCCAADMTPCGMLCEYDKASELEEDTWVTVTGVIHVGEYMGEKQPVILASEVSAAEKPDEEYVYPW